MIDDKTIARINDAVNIVDVISDFQQVRKSGVNYQSLCPFHADRHMGSFTISPKKNMCYCFTCEKGGDAV
jgi:DNA primase